MSFSVRREHRRSNSNGHECVVISLSAESKLDASSLLSASEEMLNTPTSVEILLTNGGIQDARLAELYTHISRIPKAWRVRLIDLSNNQLTDTSAGLLASLVRISCPEELCLSGNNLGNAGAEKLLDAVLESRAYPRVSSETNEPVPLWLRLDRNNIDETSLTAFLPSRFPCLTVCGAEDDECSSAQCTKGNTQVHLPDLQVQNDRGSLSSRESPSADLDLTAPLPREDSAMRGADVLKMMRELLASENALLSSTSPNAATQEALSFLMAAVRGEQPPVSKPTSSDSNGSATVVVARTLAASAPSSTDPGAFSGIQASVLSRLQPTSATALASQVLHAVKAGGGQVSSEPAVNKAALSRNAPAFVPGKTLSATAPAFTPSAPVLSTSVNQKTTTETVALVAGTLPGANRLTCGLDMIPSREGYVVTNVSIFPGQPNIQRGDRLIEINGRALVKEEASKLRQVFADELKDGVLVTLVRPALPPALDHTQVTRKLNMNAVIEGAGILWPAVLKEYGQLLGQFMVQVAKMGVTGAFDQNQAAVTMTGPRCMIDTAAATLNEKLISLLIIHGQRQVGSQ